MTYDFQEQLAFSHGIDCHAGIMRHLIDSVAGASRMVKATENEDRSGTDYWIERRNGRSLSVDFKHRSFCPIERFGPEYDDVCIETCSVFRGPNRPPFVEGQRVKVGWTLNEMKRTDFIVYTWPASDGKRRFWVVPFPQLCRTAQKHADDWASRYHERSTPNPGYWTLNVYVPRSVVRDAMKPLFYGVTA